MAVTVETRTAVLDALAGVGAVLSACEERSAQIRHRIAHIEQNLASGHELRDIVSREARPLVVELLTQTLSDLQAAGLRLRKAEAAALRHQGLTTSEIAALFGVSRQRVFTLLRDGCPETGGS
jgi:hypothetical protein